MEGLWYAHFTAGRVQGEGIAVLRDGEILGGDPAHTYAGSYTWDGPELYADVCVSPYFGGRVPTDLERPVTFYLQGSISGDTAKVSGHANNHPEMGVVVELRRAA